MRRLPGFDRGAAASPCGCVIFDVDDTLYLERDYVWSGFRAVEEIHGMAGFADAAWNFFNQGARGNIFNRALSELGIASADHVIRELVHSYRAHKPHIELLPDVARWLCLHSQGYYLGCITDGPVVSQREKVRALGIRHRCDRIILTGELGEGFGKPDTRSFRLISQLSKVHAGGHVYIADNPGKDFQGPWTLGWRTVRVRRPGSLHRELLTPAYVDVEITDLSNLDSILPELLI
jgi:putative hydrolase of the HAD superfamily